MLATGAVDLAALHMVRELLPRIPALVGEVGGYLTTVKVNMAIIERFKHPVRQSVRPSMCLVCQKQPSHPGWSCLACRL